jgi:uncharacterized protein YbjT (DUF2867 family)
MFVVTGITGQVGGSVARTLLAAKQPVRAVSSTARKKVPMVATADIGRVAAKLLQEKWSGRRVIELEGPDRVSPNDIAAELWPNNAIDLKNNPVYPMTQQPQHVYLVYLE